MTFQELVTEITELKTKFSNFLKGEGAKADSAIADQVKGFQSRLEAIESSAQQQEKDLTTARQTISTLQGEKTTLENAAKDLQGKVKDLEAKAKSGARQAADILAGTGVDPVAATTAPSTQVGEKDFVAIVKEQIAAGKTKGDAMLWAVENHPEQYAKCKKEGKISELSKL